MILSLVPGSAMAEVCEKLRPGWDAAAGPTSGLSEALQLAMSPAPLILLAASALAVLRRSSRGGMIVVLFWAAYLMLLSMADQGGVTHQARIEGCMGNPALFIAGVIAICAGIILYTARFRATNQELES
ncbi:hypothetical protein [Pseudoprimorskyibacter insulae]|uniref:hypothetical protein n=1 Tax=Pseudoprimorskyibacter insulae TaxID=1695997 RepID=UPI0011B2471D|nr:hypothetical protein [Pseudoprimorskyibacter insulae]